MNKNELKKTLEAYKSNIIDLENVKQIRYRPTNN